MTLFSDAGNDNLIAPLDFKNIISMQLLSTQRAFMNVAGRISAGFYPAAVNAYLDVENFETLIDIFLFPSSSDDVLSNDMIRYRELYKAKKEQASAMIQPALSNNIKSALDLFVLSQEMFRIFIKILDIKGYLFENVRDESI